MSTNQFLIDASTRHAVFLQRYAGGESKKAIKTLNRLRRDINARLSQEPTEFQRNRLSIILDDIDQLYYQSFTPLTQQIKAGAHSLSASEGAFAVDLFSKATSFDFILPPDSALIAAVEEAPMAAPVGMNAISIDDTLAQYGVKKAEQVKQVITDSVVMGDTTPDISRKVGQLMTTLHRRQLDTLVRTITNHTSNVARKAVYEQNDDVLDGYRWVSTLDNRTTLICMSRDNKVYTNIGIDPMPPAHFGCRSTTIPVVNPKYNLGAKVTGQRASKGASGGKPVSANKSYGTWLKTQPREFVDEALGAERSELFRAGKLSIDKFVDPTGRVYTLRELERMNPFVFADM